VDDFILAEVTERLIPMVDLENGILDLSFNNLTHLCIPALIRWIDETNLRFINLEGNSRCSMRNIQKLCKSLYIITEKNKDKVKSIMSHIFFLPQYYIYQAKKIVKLYQQLCELGYLPHNWSELQKEYYVLTTKKKICFYEETILGDPDVGLTFEEE
jgi:hypothetical protein